MREDQTFVNSKWRLLASSTAAFAHHDDERVHHSRDGRNKSNEDLVERPDALEEAKDTESTEELELLEGRRHAVLSDHEHNTDGYDGSIEPVPYRAPETLARPPFTNISMDAPSTTSLSCRTCSRAAAAPAGNSSAIL